jgi:hypothetical protein
MSNPHNVLFFDFSSGLLPENNYRKCGSRHDRTVNKEVSIVACG